MKRKRPALQLPTAEQIKIPAYNYRFPSAPGCRSYIRYDPDQYAIPEHERTYFTVGVEVWGLRGPLIGVVMRVADVMDGFDGFAAKYKEIVAGEFFGDAEAAVRWVMKQRLVDPNRSNNGLKDTREG